MYVFRSDLIIRKLIIEQRVYIDSKQRKRNSDDYLIKHYLENYNYHSPKIIKAISYINLSQLM